MKVFVIIEQKRQGQTIFGIVSSEYVANKCINNLNATEDSTFYYMAVEVRDRCLDFGILIDEDSPVVPSEVYYKEKHEKKRKTKIKEMITNTEDLLRLVDLIMKDIEKDVEEGEGKPFNGKEMSKLFGYQAAAIYALGNVVKEIINKLR